MDHGRLLVLGAGGHGKVVGDCARAAACWSEILFFDRRWPELARCGPWRVAGKDGALLEAWRNGDQVFAAVGDAVVRMAWIDRMRSAGLPLAVVSHPRAMVSLDAFVGEGSLTAPGAVINIDARVGRGCIINTGATVDHDCRIADGVHVCPGSHLAGQVSIGAGSWIGIGSTVCQGVAVGARVIVGAGAVVTADVPDGITVVGAPARPRNDIRNT
jgi:sugar O-acyltransferase (sialic acid O-acetyltransferase NeuD family)